MMSRLSLGQLTALVAVAEHQSVTVAADVLGISQPSLTKRIQSLEETTGVAMLRPSGRGVTMTPAGVEAAEAARRALTEISAIDALSESMRTLERGTLRLTGLPSLISLLGPEFVAPFHRAHPGISISMTAEEDPAAVVESLRTGRANLALCVLDAVPGDLVSIELAPQKFIAVAAGPGPLEGLLRSSTLVTLPLGTSMRAITEQVYRRVGVTAPRVLTTTQRDSLVRFALAVNGVTIVPEVYTDFARAFGGQCIELDRPTRSVGVLHAPNASRNPAVHAFLNMVVS